MRIISIFAAILFGCAGAPMVDQGSGGAAASVAASTSGAGADAAADREQPDADLACHAGWIDGAPVTCDGGE